MAITLFTEPVEIPAGAVQLRPFEAEFDVAGIMEAARDPLIQRYSPRLRGLEDPGRARAEAVDLADWGTGRDIAWAIKHITSGDLLGMVGIFGINTYHSTAEIGYWLVPGARGHGYATRAVGAASRFGFDAIGLARLGIIHAAENSASCAVARRSGFVLEATLRSSGAVEDGSVRVDEHIHGRLPGDPVPAV